MKRKNKALKTFGFTSLAMLMACTGVVAFAPLTTIQMTSASTPPTTTTGLGLNPETDPVVYTTQSGLQIKKSNGFISSSITTNTNNGKIHTQDLSGFYYFTMGTFSGTIYTAKTETDTYTVTNEPVNWIILGLGPNTSYFLDEVTANLFSTWKTNTSGINPDYTNGIANGPYFFQEVFETTSPAGQLIDSAVSAKTYIMEKVKASIPSDPADEIPEGCMLVLSEKLLGLMYLNSGGNINTTYYTQDSVGYIHCGDGGYGNRYRYKSDAKNPKAGSVTWNNKVDGSLYTYINSLFSKNASTGAIISNQLGLTKAESDLIVPQQLYTYYSNGSTHLQETPTTDSGTYYTMFPLAYKTANLSVHQSFCMEDYLPNQNQRIASIIGSNQCHFWYLRSGTTAGPNRSCTVLPSGASNTAWGNANSYATRPAMVMKLQ